MSQNHWTVFKIRSETCWTKAQFCKDLYMVKKESLPDWPKFCQSDHIHIWPVSLQLSHTDSYRYRQTCNISHTLVGNKIVDLSDVVGASLQSNMVSHWLGTNLESALNRAWVPSLGTSILTYWGRVTHICFGNLTIIGSDNGLSPGRRQAIIWTNAGILPIWPLGTNFSEILIKIDTF